MQQMDDAVPTNQKAATKRQRYNQRPGRHAVVTIPVDGLLAPVEIAIVAIDQRSGTVELEIPTGATIRHRVEEESWMLRPDK